MNLGLKTVAMYWPVHDHLRYVNITWCMTVNRRLQSMIKNWDLVFSGVFSSLPSSRCSNQQATICSYYLNYTECRYKRCYTVRCIWIRKVARIRWSLAFVSSVSTLLTISTIFIIVIMNDIMGACLFHAWPHNSYATCMRLNLLDDCGAPPVP